MLAALQWSCALDRMAKNLGGCLSPPRIGCLIHFAALILSLYFCCTAIAAQAHDGDATRSFHMPMVYKYSQEFRELAKGRPEWAHFMAAWEELPPPGSAQFYHTLATQDFRRHVAHGHRRSLAGANSTGIFSMYPANKTYLFPELGRIHFTLIELGTPPKPFLVGLDTGSDLLWVPCDCKQCSDASWSNYGLDLNIDFSIYSTTNSTTGKALPCSSSICKRTLSQGTCSTGGSCTYVSNYVAANTSSSGTVVQDVVYLNPETQTGPNVSAEIYFGCGSVQTGDFLQGGAPNGLFGLGPEVYSVPRTLAVNGITRDVFSMCFSTPSAVGRLVFGRKPAASFQSTPLISVTPNIFYVLGVEEIVAGGVSLNVNGSLVFDTGTSLTYLPSKIIESVGDALASRSNLTAWSFTYKDSLLFSYCWNATTSSEIEKLSSLSFTFRGGGTWEITNPLLLFGNNGNIDFTCLGILPLDSRSSVPIIGYNFMGNYEYYFDMETSTFSWTPSDCSGNNITMDLPPANSPTSAPAPSSQHSPSTPPLSSRSPSASPSTSSPGPPGAARGPAATESNAHRTTILKTVWIQVLFLAFSTSFIHSLLM